jgi:UDP-N-acetylmuramoyl-L-alanyl-D-glutamate--2,6-diaminopimelate ligase
MEAFPDAARDVLAVVDYAHTPDALAKALAALRQHCRGRLWCVFGCGGDRDCGKRPEMGRVAEQLADELIITDDNPRSEDGAAIVADILAGLAEPVRARVERDRAAAIRQALTAAAAGDIVLVAGKGHEEVQIVGDVLRPFSDRRLVAHLTGGTA